MNQPSPTSPPIREEIRARGKQLVERLQQLIHEGNIRKIVVRRHGQVIAELPLTVGVIGTLLAPQLAALATLVAVLSDCSIEVVRTPPSPPAA